MIDISIIQRGCPMGRKGEVVRDQGSVISRGRADAQREKTDFRSFRKLRKSGAGAPAPALGVGAYCNTPLREHATSRPRPSPWLLPRPSQGGGKRPVWRSKSPSPSHGEGDLGGEAVGEGLQTLPYKNALIGGGGGVPSTAWPRATRRRASASLPGCAWRNPLTGMGRSAYRRCHTAVRPGGSHPAPAHDWAGIPAPATG